MQLFILPRIGGLLVAASEGCIDSLGGCRGRPSSGRARRLATKIHLILFYRYEYGHDEIIGLLRLIDWMLILSPALEPAFEQALEAIEKEHNVAYVMSIERQAEFRGELMTLQQQWC